MTVRKQTVWWLTLMLLAILSAVPAWAGPRNIIIMIGDGMGPDSVAAAGAYKYGSGYHLFGGHSRLGLEGLSRHLYVTTCPSGRSYDPAWKGGDREYVKHGATDSAAAATALATGVKTTNGAIGVDPQKKPLVNIMEIARQNGLKTGIVSSVPFSHATPAGFTAHCDSRGSYTDITKNILFELQPDVVMGAGHPQATAIKDGDYTYIAKEDWEALKAGTTSYRLIESKEELKKLSTAYKGGKVFVTVPSRLDLSARKADGSGVSSAQPSLADMADGALSVLGQGRGFVLMIEGGAIDWANHGNNIDLSVGNTLGFDEAVNTVINWIKSHGGWQENLLIVTADHETGYLHDVKPGPAGTLPTVTWGTDGKWISHTNRLVDLYCQGSGSEAVEKLAREITDFERGKVRVIDNTDIFKTMSKALKAGKPLADAGAYSLRRAA